MAEKKPLVAYIVSRDLATVSSLLPSNRQRSSIVHSLVNSLSLLTPNENSDTRTIRVVKPVPASLSDLGAYHSPEYLNFVLDPKNYSEESNPTKNINAELGLEDDCPPFHGLSEYVQLVGGATLTAVDSLKVADIAICWDGGRHHAQKSRASGYCYVADCVLAILRLRRFPPHPTRSLETPRRSRVMYLDLDLHFSDGVSHAFYSPSSSNASQTLILSIHHASPGFFPSTPLAELPDITATNFDPFILSIPLHQGAGYKTFASIWPSVELIKDTFDPDYVILQCGVDALAGDPCATFNWSLGTNEGSLGWCVSRVINLWNCKTLLLGGGGYNSSNTARAWAYLTSIAIGRQLPLDTDIPDHGGWPLYGPSFTLDVSAGYMKDHNMQEYIENVQSRFRDIADMLKRRLHP